MLFSLTGIVWGLPYKVKHMSDEVKVTVSETQTDDDLVNIKCRAHEKCTGYKAKVIRNNSMEVNGTWHPGAITYECTTCKRRFTI